VVNPWLLDLFLLSPVYRLELNIAVSFKPGIDRNEIIDAVDFDTVAGKMDDGPISLPGFAGECLQRFDEPLAAEVAHKSDGFKSGVSKPGGKEFCVLRRIGKRRYC